MNPPDVTTLLNMSESEMLDFKAAQFKFRSPATDEEKSELLRLDRVFDGKSVFPDLVE